MYKDISESSHAGRLLSSSRFIPSLLFQTSQHNFRLFQTLADMMLVIGFNVNILSHDSALRFYSFALISGILALNSLALRKETSQAAHLIILTSKFQFQSSFEFFGCFFSISWIFIICFSLFFNYVFRCFWILDRVIKTKVFLLATAQVPQVLLL